MQHDWTYVERPGESHTALDGKKENTWWREPVTLWASTLRCIGIVETMAIFGHLICLRVLRSDVSVLWGQYLHHRHRDLWIIYVILWCAFYRSWDDFGYLYEDDIVLRRLWSTLWIGYYSGRKTSAIELQVSRDHEDWEQSTSWQASTSLPAGAQRIKWHQLDVQSDPWNSILRCLMRPLLCRLLTTFSNWMIAGSSLLWHACQIRPWLIWATNRRSTAFLNWAPTVFGHVARFCKDSKTVHEVPSPNQSST